MVRNCVHMCVCVCRAGVSVLSLLSVCPSRDVLFQHFESGEEGTRNVVAECVGKLTLVDPEALLPKLRVCAKSQYCGVLPSTFVS